MSKGSTEAEKKRWQKNKGEWKPIPRGLITKALIRVKDTVGYKTVLAPGKGGIVHTGMKRLKEARYAAKIERRKARRKEKQRLTALKNTDIDA